MADTAPVRAEIGVIGGSGLYELLDDATEVRVGTPYGEPSDPLVVGTVGGRSVAFVPRHGRDHRFPPHRVPYRANLWALRSVGVRQVLAPCAVGSLRAELRPGSLVVLDQVVDRTWGRDATYFDEVGGVVHASFADPYCPHGRKTLLQQAKSRSLGMHDGGTLVVVQGPRFGTRAESRWHAAAGWSVVGMTGMPEAVLARELQMCFTALAVVTDHDAGVDVGEGVTHAEVMEVFARNVAVVRDLLLDTVPHLPAADDDCVCRHGMDGQRLPFDLP